MSAFSTTIPAAATPEAPIAAGAFWPVIDPAQIRAAQRIDGTVTSERLREALIEAVASTITQLDAWSTLQIDSGYDALAEVPCAEVDGEPIHVHRFRRAVGCLAKSSVLERYRDYDTSTQGDRKADATEPGIDDLRRDAAWAIADIQGRGRTVVELI